MSSAVCLGCGARVDAGASRSGDDGHRCACTRVGQDPYRGVPPSSGLGGCPRCDKPLEGVDYADTPLDECARCGGVFVEKWILDRLVSAREARIALTISLPVRARRAEHEVRYLRCPRCSRQMNRTVFGRSSGVVVDVCKDHGIWFDTGELAAVLDFIEAGGLERVRAREQAEKEAEARKARVRRELESAPLSGLSEPVSMREELAADLVAALIDLWVR